MAPRLRIIIASIVLLCGTTTAAGAPRADQPPPRFTALGRIGAAPAHFVAAGDLLFTTEGPSVSVLSMPPAGRAQVLATLDLERGDLQDLAYDNGMLYLLTLSGLSIVDAHDPSALRALGFTPGGGQALAAQGGWVFVAARQAGVRIVDAHDPARPLIAAALATAGDASLIQISATSHTGNPLLVIGEGAAGVRVLDAASPAQLRILATLPVPAPESLALAPAGDRLWIAAAGRVEAYDLADPEHPHALGRYAPPTQARRVLYRNNYAYLVDAGDGLKVLDMRSQAQPLLVWSESGRPAHDLIMAGTALALSGAGGIRFYDLADPARPRETGALDLGSAWGMATARDARVGGQPITPLLVSTDDGLVVVDARDPAQPREVARLAVAGSPHDVALAADETRAYLALSQPGGLAVVDVRDWGQLRPNGRLEVAGAGEALATRTGTVYLSAGAGGFHVIDVINPAEPRLIATLAPEPGQDFGDLTLGETRAYIAAGTEAIAVDIGARARPTLLTRIPAPASGVFLYSAGGYLAVAGAGELHWVYVRARGEAIDTGIYRRPASPLVLALAADQLLVASGAVTQPGQSVPDVVFVDAQDVAQPRELARFGDGPGGVSCVHFAGMQALFTAGYRGLLRYDLATPPVEAPAQPAAFAAVPPEPVHTPPVSILRLSARAGQVVVSGDRGWAALSLGDPAHPQIVGAGSDVRATVDAAVSGTIAYAASGSGVVTAFDLAGTAAPLATWDSHSQLAALAASDEAVFAGDMQGGLHVLSAGAPVQLAELAQLSLPAGAHRIVVDEGYAYVAAGSAGLRIVDVRAPAAGLTPSGRGVLSPTLAIAAAGGRVATLDGRSLLLWGEEETPLARRVRATRLALVVRAGEAPRMYVDADRAIAVVEALTTTLRLSSSKSWLRAVRALAAAEPAGRPLLLVGDEAGLTLVDWADAARPPRTLAVITATGSVDLLAAAGDTLWSAGSRLVAVDAADPAAPRVAGGVDLPLPATALAGSETQAAVGASDGVRLFVIDDRGAPAMRGALGTPSAVRALAMRGDRLYAALESNGLWVIAIGADGGLRRLVSYPAPPGSSAVGLSADGDELLVAWHNAWQALDIGHPAEPPAEVGALALGTEPAQALDVAVRDGVAVIASGDAGLWVADVRDPAAPEIVGHVVTPGDARGVALGDDVAFVADGPCGLHAYGLQNEAWPQDLGWTPGESAQDVAWYDGLLYVVDAGDLRTLGFDAAGELAPPPAPVQPEPADGDEVAAGEVTLSWGGSAAACAMLTYDVAIEGTAPPPTARVYGLAEPRWSLPALEAGTYTWHVVVHDAQGGETKGPEWRFTVPAAPAAPAMPTTAPPAQMRPASDDGTTIGLAILAGLGFAVLLGILWRMRRPGRR